MKRLLIFLTLCALVAVMSAAPALNQEERAIVQLLKEAQRATEQRDKATSQLCMCLVAPCPPGCQQLSAMTFLKQLLTTAKQAETMWLGPNYEVPLYAGG